MRQPVVEGFDDLELIDERGGVALWRARDRSGNGRVLLRVFTEAPRDRLVTFEHDRARLGRLAGAPGFVTVLGTTLDTDGHPVVVVPNHDDDLEAWIDDGPTLWTDAVETIAEASEILDRAHQRGVVHGRIAPPALRVDDNGTLGVDDLAWGALVAAPPTEYVAPEVRRGRPQSTPADVYALTSVLWAMLAGHHPPSSFEAGVPVPYEALPSGVMQLLAAGLTTDPNRRIQDAGTLAREARRLLEQPVGTAGTGAAGSSRVPTPPGVVWMQDDTHHEPELAVATAGVRLGDLPPRAAVPWRVTFGIGAAAALALGVWAIGAVGGGGSDVRTATASGVDSTAVSTAPTDGGDSGGPTATSAVPIAAAASTIAAPSTTATLSDASTSSTAAPTSTRPTVTTSLVATTVTTAVGGASVLPTTTEPVVSVAATTAPATTLATATTSAATTSPAPTTTARPTTTRPAVTTVAPRPTTTTAPRPTTTAPRPTTTRAVTTTSTIPPVSTTAAAPPTTTATTPPTSARPSGSPTNIRWVAGPTSVVCWTRPFPSYKVAWDGDQSAYVVWRTNTVGTQGSQGGASMPLSFDYPSARTVSISVTVGGVQSPSLSISVSDDGNGCTGA